VEAHDRGAPIVLGRNSNGKVFELVERKLALAAAEQNGFDIFAREVGAPPASRADQEKERAAKREESEAAKVNFDVALEVLGEVVFDAVELAASRGRANQISKCASVALATGHAGREGRALVARRRNLDDGDFAASDLAGEAAARWKDGSDR
jgi:hypothetical protein